ncbi:hypothetical protein [Maribacter antarcticus]|uniref:hypothetical protein n=1 Tax=Maribacter antarcticus TaxID=505250 RepID=UPI00047EF844|nr:hypothetical protein [Maribacter antarcticus]
MKDKASFVCISIVFVTAIVYISSIWPPVLWSFVLVAPLVLMGIFDMFQKDHTIRRNYPLVGRFR